MGNLWYTVVVNYQRTSGRNVSLIKPQLWCHDTKVIEGEEGRRKRSVWGMEGGAEEDGQSTGRETGSVRGALYDYSLLRWQES